MPLGVVSDLAFDLCCCPCACVREWAWRRLFGCEAVRKRVLADGKHRKQNAHTDDVLCSVQISSGLCLCPDLSPEPSPNPSPPLLCLSPPTLTLSLTLPPPSPRLRAVAAKQQHPAPATATRRGGASRRRRRSRQGLLTKDRGGWRTGRPHGLHQLQLGCRLNARGTCRNFPRRKRASLRRTGRLQDGPPDPDD